MSWVTSKIICYGGGKVLLLSGDENPGQGEEMLGITMSMNGPYNPLNFPPPIVTFSFYSDGCWEFQTNPHTEGFWQC